MKFCFLTSNFFRLLRNFSVFQVLDSRGQQGHNVEYVLKLADWIRETLPDVVDEHLFDIEKDIRTKINQRGLCLNSLMRNDLDEHVEEAMAQISAEQSEPCASKSECGFSSQVRQKCLRCVKK